MMTVREISIKQFPKCNVSSCDNDAHYDAPTKLGPWAYLCEEHFKERGIYGGSKFVLIVKRKEEHIEGVPKVNLTYIMDDYGDGDAHAICPACGNERHVELDANYEVTCESCKQRYKCVSMF